MYIITTTTQVYDGWTNWTISEFTLWGVMDFPLFFLPSAYLLSRSLRYSVVAGTACMFVGSVLRCLPLLFPSVGHFTLLCHLGGFINAIGGPIAMAAPIQISAAWFPPNERTRATSISQMFNALGVGVSNLLGTLVVREVHMDDTNEDTDDVDIKTIQNDIEVLLYVYAGVSTLIFILVLFYFPSEPPSPPSNSASEDRLGFLKGLKNLVLNRNAWPVTITYAMSQGLVQMWQTSMVINLTSMDIGVSETWASTLSTVISFSAVGVSIIIATFMDYFRKKMKLAIIILLCSSGLIFIFCTLITESIITISEVSQFKTLLYLLLVTGVSLACGCAPITFEFCAELCYPVAEGTIGTWLCVWFNNISVIYFTVFGIEERFQLGLGTRWLNYVLPCSVLLPLPLLLLVQEDYKRSQLDDTLVDA